MKLGGLIVFAVLVLCSCSKSDGPVVQPAQDTLGSWKVAPSTLPAAASDLHFISPQQGFATVPGFGLYQSADSGRSWQKVSLSVQANRLSSIVFLDPQYGFALGELGFAYTTNGGNSWQQRNNLTIGSPTDISFVSPSTGYAASADGIYRTTDTGSSWQLIRSGAVSSIVFLDAQNGWAATGTPLTIIRTSNGGTSWTSQYSASDNKASVLSFASLTEGWATATGGILRTTNGQTWQKINLPMEFSQVRFVTGTMGYGLSGQRIYKTFDGGMTWTQDLRLVNSSLEVLHFADPQYGWAVTSNGIILRLTP